MLSTLPATTGRSIFALRWPPEFVERPYEPAAHRLCSLCGKPELLVEKLIAGPGII